MPFSAEWPSIKHLHHQHLNGNDNLPNEDQMAHETILGNARQ